ncbi:MAG TPA: tetratricopeptide repeat protein [Candidatus Limnocylindrales bacterium]|jgi:class 3 adenylate cyclase/tetratricopeptide (TPR) repeat protein|nr:tetratricopeptide repeat protein [Candidatus Limnocylindrales bacterium]
MEPATTPLTRDEPEAYIARDRRRALADHVDMPDRVVGAALFADISGFTPLTESLAAELGPQRGAEELTAHLGRAFHAIIDELDRRGGDVIYFSGDAITCWLDGDDGLRATAAALAMQATMARIGSITTPGGTAVQLQLKVAVAVGRARRFVVGDPDIQLIDVLAGALIDDLAEAEHHADKGEVVLDASALAALGGRVMVADQRVDPATGRTFGVVGGLLADVPTIDVVEPPALDEALVRPWLLPAVYERLRAGRGEFLAELRPAYPVFLRFAGIDYDHDPDAVAKLDTFIQHAQRIMAGYGGNVLQLTLGDKGAYLYGIFGSPVAHEDDAARAAAAALELRDLERTTDAREIQIGLTRGRLRSGTYGHAMRRTFVCLGDAVNLAARLMAKAPAGRIYVDDRIRQEAGEAYIWERLPDLAVKGKKGTVVAHALIGSLERASRRKTRYQLDLVGRRAELDQLAAALEATLAGDGRIVGIAAEAGMGKSRLIAEFVRTARRRGLFVAFGECQSFGTNTSYFVWREIWHRLFGLEDGDPAAVRQEQVRGTLAAIDPTLVARAPLLGAMLGVDIPDTELTSSFDAKLRKASLEDLLSQVLRARVAREPVILVLEDCHWIDALSRDLLEVLGRSAAALPVLFVLAYRPAADPGGGLAVASIPDFSEIRLAELEPGDAGALIRRKLEQVLGASAPMAVSDELTRLVRDRAQGNPFYIEELISYIGSAGVDPTDAAAMRSLQLPDSLHSLVLSRIDAMAEEPRRTLKVASVVGRVFEAPILPGAYPDLGALPEVIDHLQILRAADLVSVDREQDHAYLFKHVATQEVAYESLPFAVRRDLHGRIGTYLEAMDPTTIDRRLDLLAHHFWNSDDQARKRRYLERAAEAARAGYANAAAIDYLTRLTPLLEGAERAAILVTLAKVQELAGDWTGAENSGRDALAISTDLGDLAGQGWAHASLAEVTRRLGRFDEASHHLVEARARFEAVGADDGIGQVLHLAGTIAAQRGDYDTAQARYEDSLAIRERLGDRASMGALYSNLGVIAMYRDDYPEARRLNERAITLRRQVGDRWAIGVSETNLGMIDLHEGDFAAARGHFDASMRMNREIGDPWMVAICHNNLGNATRGLGDAPAARDHYAASMRAYEEVDDRWALSFLLEDIGILAAMTDDPARAFEVIGAAESLRAAIGSPRSPSLEDELTTALAGARATLGEEAVAAALERGRSLDAAAAVALGLAVCGVQDD